MRPRSLAARAAAVLLAAPALGAQQAQPPAAATPAASSTARVQYPATRTVDQVDDYHGTRSPTRTAGSRTSTAPRPLRG
jgi:hypothetical protein